MSDVLYTLFSPIVKFLFQGQTTTKKIKGLDMKLRYEKAQHINFLFQKEISYEFAIQEKILKFIQEGDLVFDIGANIGQYALPFSAKVGQKGKVISFEPDPNTFSLLQLNKKANQCQNLICFNHGLGDQESELEFYRDTQTGGRRGSFKKEFVGNNYDGHSEKVSIKKLDTIVSEFGKPDFVKIDVEGFEVQVLEGLTIDLLNCVFLVETRGETKEAVYNYFNEKDFDCFWIDEKDELIIDQEKIPKFANLLFKKRNSSL